MTTGGVDRLPVVYIVSTLARTGPTTQLFNIVRHLDPGKVRPCVVTLSPESGSSACEDFADAGVKLASLGLGRLSGAFFASGALKRLLSAKDKPAIVHSVGVRADIISNGIAPAIAKVSTLRNFPQFDYTLTYGRLPGTLMARGHMAALRRKDAIVCVSDAVEENVRSLGVGKTVVIRNGVDTDAFRPVDPDEKARLRQQYGWPADATMWIAAGALTERKNPAFLIRAFGHRFGADPSHQLVLVGSGNLEPSLKLEYASDSNIRFVGQVKTVRDYLRMSDAFVSASLAEGMPNAALEAIVSGLPALLSDIAPHRELSALAPDRVVLFTPGDERSFAMGVEPVSAKARDGWPPIGLAELRDRLGAVAMARSYQELYLGLCRDRL